jgi:hypothetical protein
MHAVVVRVKIDDLEAAKQMLHNVVVPGVSSQEGFVHGVWLEPVNGEGLSISVFETEAQARGQQVEVPPDAPVEILSVDVREVYAQA